MHQLCCNLVFDPPPCLPAPVHWSEHTALTATLTVPCFLLIFPVPFFSMRNRTFSQAQARLWADPAVARQQNDSPYMELRALSASVSGRDTLPGSSSHYKSIPHHTRNERFSTSWTFCVTKGWKCQEEKKKIQMNQNFKYHHQNVTMFFYLFFIFPIAGWLWANRNNKIEEHGPLRSFRVHNETWSWGYNFWAIIKREEGRNIYI